MAGMPYPIPIGFCQMTRSPLAGQGALIPVSGETLVPRGPKNWHQSLPSRSGPLSVAREESPREGEAPAEPLIEADGLAGASPSREWEPPQPPASSPRASNIQRMFKDLQCVRK